MDLFGGDTSLRVEQLSARAAQSAAIELAPIATGKSAQCRVALASGDASLRVALVSAVASDQPSHTIKPTAGW